MTLWLARHAEVLCPPGLCYGSTDWPADAAATARAAAVLARELPAGTSVAVSPLARCQQLAEALHPLRPELARGTDARLREMHFGAWEGRPWRDIARPEFDAWMADFAHARPGGDGETVAELMARVAAAWDQAQASTQPVAWITHAGVMRAARLLARGARQPARAADWPADALPMGGVWVLGAGAPRFL